MANKKIKGITIKFGADTMALDKALKDVDKTSRSLGGELKSVNRLLKFDPKNTQLLAQKQELLNEQIGNTSKKLDALKQAQEEVEKKFKSGDIGAEEYRNFQRTLSKTEQDLKSYTSQLEKLNDVSGNVSRKIQDVGDSIKKVGGKVSDAGKAIAPLSGALAGAGVASSKMSMDFEDAMAKVSTIADETEVPLSKLEDGIKELSNQTGISATEIADNVYNAISAGQKTGDHGEFIRSMLMRVIVLQLLKDRLGISTDSRDSVLYAIIDGILDECENVYGVRITEERYDHILLVLDWATWKYNHPEDGVIPRSIRFRLNNLMIKVVQNESNMG